MLGIPHDLLASKVHDKAVHVTMSMLHIRLLQWLAMQSPYCRKASNKGHLLLLLVSKQYGCFSLLSLLFWLQLQKAGSVRCAPHLPWVQVMLVVQLFTVHLHHLRWQVALQHES